MQVTVQGRNLDIPQPLEDNIRERLEQMADRYSFVHEGTVFLGKQRKWFTAEVTLHVRHQILRAEERSNDIGASVDNALDKLDRQLHRHKGRLIHRSRAGDWREAPPLTAFEPEEPEEEYQAPRVVRVKQISVKPMSVEEAALQMELLGHDFYVFRNDETDDLNVVYLRRNGDVGLIQPE